MAKFKEVFAGVFGKLAETADIAELVIFIRDAFKKEAEKRTRPRKEVDVLVMETVRKLASVNPHASERLRKRHGLRQAQSPRTYGANQPYGPLDEDRFMEAMGMIYTALVATPPSPKAMEGMFEYLGSGLIDEEFDLFIEMTLSDTATKVAKHVGGLVGAGWQVTNQQANKAAQVIEDWRARQTWVKKGKKRR